MAPVGWKRIKSKFTNRCKHCREYVTEGSDVYWLKGYGILHVKCYEESKEVGGETGYDGEEGKSVPFPDGNPDGNPGSNPGDNAEDNDGGDADTDTGGDVEDDVEQDPDDDMDAWDGKEWHPEGDHDTDFPERNPDTDMEQDTGYKPGSRQDKIAKDLIQKDMNVGKCQYGELGSEVQRQERPMIYMGNTGKGFREPKPIKEQFVDFNKEVVKIKREMMEKDRRRERAPDTKEEAPSPRENPTPNPEPTPELDEREWYLAEVTRLRKFCADSSQMGQHIDEISMRPIVEGKKAYENGIPLAAMIQAMTVHWPDSTRQTANVRPFKLESVFPAEKGKHRLIGYIRKLAEARIPIMLVGPKGTGKSYLAQQLADEMGLRYAYLSMNGATTPSWLFGNWTPDPNDPYKTRPLKELYRNGGVFCVDEIDAGESNMLLILNNLISSDILQCPMTGELIQKHPDFIIVATANTFGLGATKEYRGRERQDDALLDRFRMGRVEIELDKALEKAIFYGEV